MASVSNDVAELFALLDRCVGSHPIIVGSILERILFLQPDSQRAQLLLEGLGDATAFDDPVTQAIEEAEDLAGRGQKWAVQEAIGRVRERFGSHPVAMAWLASTRILWE